MKTRSDIHARLASSLKEARKSKGLSLDAVARLSGVSRSMVNQIERGESSPTVATLWNLTQALRVDFAGLLRGGTASGIDVLRRDGAPVIEGLGKGVVIRILSPAEEVGKTEVYELVFEPGGVLDSQPHAPGCRESLTVIDGTIMVTSGVDACHLSAGDTARYSGDRPHSLAADEAPARALLIVQDS